MKRPSASILTKALAGLKIAAVAAAAGLALFGADAALAQDAAATVAEAVAVEAPAEAVANGVVVEEAPAATVDKGDVSWMMTSTVLVLLMIVPGLALFYGGLVRTKNMLSMLMQISTVTVIGMIAWTFWGYSIAFTDGAGATAPFIGGLEKIFLGGVTPDSTAATFSEGVEIPEYVFFAFQMTFACITAALVIGGVAERMKFAGVVVFAILWPLLSYYPIAHMVWWGTGIIFTWGAFDFAGGTVVHINAGIAALVGAIILGARTGYRSEPMPPHSLTLTFVGAGLLWVGWFGFNAGSNLEATGGAALAMVNTFVATAAAGFSWIVMEWITRGKPSMLGMASGIVAGLVAVTPAAGLIGPIGAIVLGLVVSPICVVFCSTIKNALKYDDSLDAFGIHAIGGIIGSVGTGILAAPSLGGFQGEDYDMVGQTIIQVQAVGLAVVWAAVASIIVFGLIRAIGQLRVSRETEMEGLDINEHGERAYHS